MQCWHFTMHSRTRVKTPWMKENTFRQNGSEFIQHIIFDHSMNEDVLIVSNPLTNPDFQMGLWYARERCKLMDLDSAGLSPEERYMDTLGDAGAEGTLIALTMAYREDEYRFVTEGNQYHNVVVSDKLLGLDLVLLILLGYRHASRALRSSTQVRHFVTSLRNAKVLACPPVMDYIVFLDNAWCSGTDEWMQTQYSMITPLPRVPVATALPLKPYHKLNFTASTVATSEHATRPVRKRSGSMSLQSDAPPKRLKLGPLKGWGVERDGIKMRAIEYAQKHWNEFQEEYPEMMKSNSDILCEEKESVLCVGQHEGYAVPSGDEEA
ncbi:hypothetical protein B0H14DRAFT_2597609 [Mycena olivaceomarginata]|nr:hypothetical protein B0H14DRAFT_2597609 [Mycena olivaceomarginata]